MSNTLENGRLAVRVPRVIAQDSCIERCGKLKNTVGHALGLAAAEAQTAFQGQRAVVCHKAAKLTCNAETVFEGFVQSDIVLDGANVLRGSVSAPSVGGTIANAMNQGATEHTIAEVFDR